MWAGGALTATGATGMDRSGFAVVAGFLERPLSGQKPATNAAPDRFHPLR
ncbi:hypothetical protein [Paenibacillus wenxiniae]|uniref:Uncharacterized protein n=1 Tax=Paenibacillus wenxiniae TaxID=1636843 RepID=A0ABW4RKK2_9BACL